MIIIITAFLIKRKITHTIWEWNKCVAVDWWWWWQGNYSTEARWPWRQNRSSCQLLPPQLLAHSLFVPPHIHPACSLPSCLLRLLRLLPGPFLACSRAFQMPPLDDKWFLIHFKLLQLIILTSCLFFACLRVLSMFHLLISHPSLSLSATLGIYHF